MAAAVCFACPQCKLQFESDKLRPGMLFRCSCGRSLRVPQATPQDPRNLHCASCGALLDPGRADCAYCGGRISLQEKNLDRLCPACFTRLPNDARHCVNCGVAINPLHLAGAGTGRACPRCAQELQARRLEEHNLLECPGCGGLWLSEQTFQSVCSAPQAQGQVAHQLHPLRCRPAAAPLEEDVRYLKCPECGHLMNRRNFAECSGVIIDLCREHGVWLDCQELERILAFVRQGGLAAAEKRQAKQAVREEAQRRERLARLRARAPGLDSEWSPAPPPPPAGWTGLVRFIAENLLR